MKAGIKKIAQWALLSALCVIGTISFMILASDEDPMNPMPIAQFFVLKMAALGVIALCVWIGKRLHRKGYLPEYINTVTEEE